MWLLSGLALRGLFFTRYLIIIVCVVCVCASKCVTGLTQRLEGSLVSLVPSFHLYVDSED